MVMIDEVDMYMWKLTIHFVGIWNINTKAATLKSCNSTKWIRYPCHVIHNPSHQQVMKIIKEDRSGRALLLFIIKKYSSSPTNHAVMASPKSKTHPIPSLLWTITVCRILQSRWLSLFSTIISSSNGNYLLIKNSSILLLYSIVIIIMFIIK